MIPSIAVNMFGWKEKKLANASTETVFHFVNPFHAGLYYSNDTQLLKKAQRNVNVHISDI